MPKLDGIIGYDEQEEKLLIDLPPWLDVHINSSPKEAAELKVVFDALANAAKKYCAGVFRKMLAKTPNAEALAKEFENKLGV